MDAGRPSGPIDGGKRERRRVWGPEATASARECLFFHEAIDPMPMSLVSTHTLARTRWLLGLAAVLLFLVGHAPEAQAQSSSPAATVDMTNTLSFAPDTVRVQAGETVRWTNGSVIVHTVTADPEEATTDESVRLPEGATPFDSGTLDPEERFEHTFEVPGTYRYFCIPHEGAKMYGTVIVTPAE